MHTDPLLGCTLGSEMSSVLYCVMVCFGSDVDGMKLKVMVRKKTMILFSADDSLNERVFFVRCALVNS